MPDHGGVRCVNQHYVPDGIDACRRCSSSPPSPPLRLVHAGPVADGHAGALALTGSPPHATVTAPSAILTLGGYAARRNRLAAIDAGVLAAATMFVAGSVVQAVLGGVLVGLLAAAALAAGGDRLLPPPGRAALPAMYSDVRVLERLSLVPVAVAAVCALVAFFRIA